MAERKGEVGAPKRALDHPGNMDDGQSCGEHGGEAGTGQGQKATRPNQGPPELPRKAANVKCLTTSKMPLLGSESDWRRREKCLRGDPHD